MGKESQALAMEVDDPNQIVPKFSINGLVLRSAIALLAQILFFFSINYFHSNILLKFDFFFRC